MYFIDRSKIDKTLVYIDTLLHEFEQCSFDTPLAQLGLERITHMLIESILDVGNMMIDGFIMRDPGSYEDIIDILVDEKVIPEEFDTGYKAVIELRNAVVRDYLDLDHASLEETIAMHKEILDEFSHCVKQYLDQELGVAHAFSNE